MSQNTRIERSQPRERVLTVLVSRQELTGANRKCAAHVRPLISARLSAGEYVRVVRLSLAKRRFGACRFQGQALSRSVTPAAACI
jgi:hypothetical protein